MGGRSLKLTDTTEPMQGATFKTGDRAKTEAETMRQSRGRGSKVETEARPCEAEPAKKLPRSRPPRAEADASRTTSLVKNDMESLGLSQKDVQFRNGDGELGNRLTQIHLEKWPQRSVCGALNMALLTVSNHFLGLFRQCCAL